MKINSTNSQFILVILLTVLSFQVSIGATTHKFYTSKYAKKRAPGGGPNLISFSLLKNNYGVGYTNIDGIVAVFDSSFSKNIGPEDSRKLFNGGENITFYDAGNFLSIDGLPNPIGGDTINVYLYSLQNDSSYKLSIDATMFYYNIPGVQGYVLDRFLSTTTKLNADSNVIAFKPKTANTATFQNRFAIFFKQLITTTSITNLSDCNAVTYKGNTYTSSTVLRDTVKSFEGLDSVYNVINIAIANITTKTNNVAFSGCNSVTYNGNTYTNATIVRDTVKSYQGCDSIYNVANIVVNHITTSTNTTNVSGCNSVTYNGNTYTNATTLRDTVKSYQGCDSIYNVANIVVNHITTSTNTTNLSGCNSVTYNGITYTSSTVIRDTVKSYQGCDSIYNVVNIVVNHITASTNTTNLSGCNSVTYNGITYTSSTVIRDTVKSYQGCDSIYNIANIVITTPITPTVTLSSNTLIANGSPATFTASPVNGGSGTIYSFIINSVTVQTGVSNTYTSSALLVGDTVSCSITSNATCVTNSNAVSNIIVMTTNVPLTLLGFQASINNNVINCSWQTTAEINTAYFNLQRSVNGTEFSTISTIKANGISKTENKYRMVDAITDELLRSSAMYYRLQMVDKDGKYAYSKTVKINLSNKNNFTIYPNPTKDYVNVTGTNINTIKLTDIGGRILLSRKNINTNVTQLDISKLSKGIYLINILSNSGESWTEKLLIE